MNRTAESLDAASDKWEQLLENAHLKLADKNRELANTQTQFHNFTYNVSHDLNAPLRAISNFSAFLLDEYVETFDEQALEYFAQITKATDDIKQRIEGLTRLSRIFSYNRPLARFSLADALTTAIDNLNDSIHESGTTFEFDELPFVFAYPELIHQLFANLIENAIRFRAAESPVIRVAASVGRSECLVSVKDNGLGIEDKFQERIFEIFHQKSRESIGAGVGLTICHAIVDRHCGRIWVESPVDGQGSEFHFSLPQPTTWEDAAK